MLNNIWIFSKGSIGDGADDEFFVKNCNPGIRIATLELGVKYGQQGGGRVDSGSYQQSRMVPTHVLPYTPRGPHKYTWIQNYVRASTHTSSAVQIHSNKRLRTFCHTHCTSTHNARIHIKYQNFSEYTITLKNIQHIALKVKVAIRAFFKPKNVQK